MDFMRKLVRGGTVSQSSQPYGTSNEHTYELLALRRKFLEICHPQRALSSKDQEDKLYSMLPLFYKVFNNALPKSMREKFGDVLQFSTQVSKLMVTEIRRRASDKSTEEASSAITEFLLVQVSEEKSRGWLLLNVLCLLASGGQNIVDCMTTMHLPSTLVKCLYLFFDLPAIPTAERGSSVETSPQNTIRLSDVNVTPPRKSGEINLRHFQTLEASSPKYSQFHQGSRVRHASTLKGSPHHQNSPQESHSILEHSNSSLAEKRMILHKTFVQTLMRLCRHISPAEELSHRDDLGLLFSAVTSWCPPHNKEWRRAASEILNVISRHGLSHNVVQYIRSKQCILTCVDNLRRSMSCPTNIDSPDISETVDGEISDLDLVEALVSILRFIRDTAEVTQLILEDFRQCHGYDFILEFLFKLEALAVNSDLHKEAVRSVVSSLEVLTLCGFLELSPGPTVQSTPFQSNFIVPTPLGKGTSVRNIQAFQVLEQAFIRGQKQFLCCGVLDSILNIYKRDPVNYFILAGQHTLSSLSECLLEKPSGVLSKFFALLEYIAIDLGYVPCKELVSITLILKDEKSLECCSACVESLKKVLSSNSKLYKDVYKDVGVLEVLVNCLHRYAAVLKSSDVVEENRTQLGHLSMELLVDLLRDCPSNAAVFRETGGARCAHNLVPYAACRSHALNLVEALILQPGSSNDDDDMGTLLGLLSTVRPTDLILKTDILESLLKVISLSSDAKVMFRKVGGFINVISVLVSVEGCLEHPTVGLWSALSLEGILILLEVTFQTLCVALRLPSNKKFFQSEVRFQSLQSAVRFLGCFVEEDGCDDLKQTEMEGTVSETIKDDATSQYPKLSGQFAILLPLSSFNPSLPLSMLVRDSDLFASNPNCLSVIAVFRLLYLLATDSFKDEVQKKIQLLEDIKSSSSDASITSPSSILSLSPESGSFTKHTPDCVHPSAVNVMLILVRAIPDSASKQMQIDLQYYILEEINSLLNSERNQQVLCRSGLLITLLRFYSDIVNDDDHPLNLSIQKIMERLATQSVTPRELRDFLRIGNPLHCKDEFISSGPVCLSRVKNLVSMATPRNIGFQDDGSVSSLNLPAFLEFDMSNQGSSYLFIPSLFPLAPPSVSVVGQADVNVISGIGVGERFFPPTGGLAVSTWIYIEKFCSNHLHPIRLLTITREILSNHSEYACLCIQISAKDRRVVISTQEEQYSTMGLGDLEAVSELISTSAAFPTNNLLQECQWSHLTVVINKATVLKHSTVAVYLNGRLLGTSKLRYIHTNPGSLSSTNSPIIVRAYIGTSPHLSARSSLLWRMASMHIIDESSHVNPASVQAQFQMGPSYIGNFQSISLPDGSIGPVVSEEHICITLFPHSCETMSMSRLRRHCPKLDYSSISRVLNHKISNGLTPILLVWNSCSHLLGPARSVGAVAIHDRATASVRSFSPGQVARVLQNIGGTTIILSLVSMATDVESLYAAVKSLVCIVKSNKAAAEEMDRMRGYQALAIHLKRKKSLLNSHVLHLAYSIVGTVDAGRESASIPNVTAFEDLLCDLEVWHNAPNELHRSLFEHIHDLLTESSENCRIIQERGMVKRCIHFLLSDSTLSHSTVKSIFRIMKALLNTSENHSDLLRFGQMLVSTIPPFTESENSLELKERKEDFEQVASQNSFADIPCMTHTPVLSRTVHIRNMALQLLCECIKGSSSDVQFCEDLQRRLGWDWVMLFMQQHLHSSTVVEALLLLLEMLRFKPTGFRSSHPSSVSNSSLSSTSSASLVAAGVTGAAGMVSTIHSSHYDRFRLAELCGGWLDGTEALLESTADSLLGFNVGSGADKPYRQVCREACAVPGFQAMASLLPHHAQCPGIYITLLQFAVNENSSRLPDLRGISLDLMYEHIFGIQSPSSTPGKVSSKLKSSSSLGSLVTSGQPTAALSLEIFQVILSIVRSMLNQNWKNKTVESWIETYPVVIIQTLIFIYQFNYNGVASSFCTPEFLSHLAATIFPKPDDNSYNNLSHTRLSLSAPTSPTEADQHNPLLANISPTASSKGLLLTNHPCKKYVFNLLQHILFDSFSLPSSGKQSAVTDIILEFSPEHCTMSQLKEFQTDVIHHLFSNLVAAEPFSGETGILLTHGSSYNHKNGSGKKGSMSAGTAYANLQQNVAYFTSRVVDRVWLNMYNNDTKEIYNFIRDMLTQAKMKSSHCPLPLLEGLYRSMYRVILYQLSRRHQSVSEQITVLDALHCITNHRDLILETKHTDQLFISAVCHCLFMLSGDSMGHGFGIEEEHRQTTWHIVNDIELSGVALHQFSTNSSAGGEESVIQVSVPGMPTSPQEKGKAMLSTTAARVWSLLMASKKSTVEEIFKVSFHDLGSSQSNLDTARLKIRDPAAKVWSNYLALEKKGHASVKEVIYSNKLAKRMSSLVILGGGKKMKKEYGTKSQKQFILQDNSFWTVNHINLVQDLVNFQHNTYRQDQGHLVRYADDEWTETSKELVRERGVWGPDRPSPLHKWMLDSTEGPCRMRKKMMRNDSFYDHYPHKTKEEVMKLKLKHRKAISKDSKKFYLHVNQISSDNEDETIDDSVELERLEMKAILRQEVEEINAVNEKQSDDIEPVKNRTEPCLNDEADILKSDSNMNGIEPEPDKKKDVLDSTLTDTKVFADNSVATQVADESADINENAKDKTLILQEKDEELNDKPDENLSTKDSVEPEASSAMDSVQKSKSISREDSKDSPKTDSKSKSELKVSESQASLFEQDNRPDNQTVLRLLDEGEKIRHMFRCARVQGLDTYEGLLLFGKENFYIIDGFTMLKSKEIQEIVSLPPGYHDPIIPETSRPGHNPTDFQDQPASSPSTHMCSKFSFDDIREVHKRRYLLQNIALEVFSRDGRNYLLVFPQGTRNKVYQKFVSFATTLADDSKDLVIGQKITANIEQQGPALLSNIMGEKTVTQRWERGEISNFQYLMYINTLAGRSYNDLMQYPVFPWVLADYTSEVLDFTNPKTFRDFSKPMGAQSSNRLQQFKKRYREWEDLGGETPPYHYGTHYSSAMIVASYLVRMEPFTQHFLRLQGGHFDLADRMFHSIGDAWHSASEKNMADVKELIPEFFYLSEFLLNSNNFDLGKKQNGIQLHDVLLPLWSKNNSREFIRIHREALECDYVSAHLHEWIDLIFGYKQKGEPALEANNVFHHLFYEGKVDIYSIKDPLKRSATIGFINNFGQIPKQLFKKPHPQKRVMQKPSGADQDSNSLSTFSISPPLDKVFYRHLDNLKHSSTPVKELKSAVIEIIPVERGLLAVEKNKLLIPSQFSRYLSWGNSDLSIRIGYYESERALQVYENLDCGEIKCATMANDTTLITGGTNAVVCVWKLPGTRDKAKNLQLKQSLFAHTETVTCVASCPAYGILVSGSQDTTSIIWDLNRLSFVRQLRGHKHAVSHTCINDLTGDIVTCDSTYVHVWTINGVLITSINTILMNARRQRITAVATCKLNDWDSNAVICTGHSDGYVRFWSIEHVQVPEKFNKAEEDRQSLKSASQIELSDMFSKRFSTHLDRSSAMVHDERSLDSLSIASGQAPADFLNVEKTQSMDNINQSQVTSNAKAKSLLQKAPDAESILSVGELTVLPWTDVPPLELTNNSENTEKVQFVNKVPVVKNAGGSSSVTLVSTDEYTGGNLTKVTEVDLTKSYVQVGDTSKEDRLKNLPSKSQDGSTASPVHNSGVASRNHESPSTISEDDFVMVDKSQIISQQEREGTLLLPGFMWKEQLVLKNKLQVPSNKDNSERSVTPEVTAIAMSKDHHKLFIGDGTGRVYAWMSAD